ncbi:MAG: hypothetical protein AB8B56_10610 [Crocinitomicaceae bacterium]
MMRLLFIPFFAFALFSCDDASKEVDPLFYQISKADSTRCMDEILDGLIDESRRKQDFQDSIMSMVYVPHYCDLVGRDIFRIDLNSNGQLMVNHDLDSLDLVEQTYQYFMFNRSLTSAETNQFAMDPKYEGFDKPFYNRFSLEEIERRIEEELAQANQVKGVKGADPTLVHYMFSKVEEWEKRKLALELIGTDELVELSPQAALHFEYHEETEQSQLILRQIAYDYYQMRNYECLLYFGETYLSLYERHQRLRRKLDQDKLAALLNMRPARIICIDRSKPSTYYGEIEPPELAK